MILLMWNLKKSWIHKYREKISGCKVGGEQNAWKWSKGTNFHMYNVVTIVNNTAL